MSGCSPSKENKRICHSLERARERDILRDIVLDIDPEIEKSLSLPAGIEALLPRPALDEPTG
jgi:hypothetical protein